MAYNDTHRKIFKRKSRNPMKMLTQKIFVREVLSSEARSCLKIFESELLSILRRIRCKTIYCLNMCWVVMNFSKSEIFWS